MHEFKLASVFCSSILSRTQIPQFHSMLYTSHFLLPVCTSQYHTPYCLIYSTGSDMVWHSRKTHFSSIALRSPHFQKRSLLMCTPLEFGAALCLCSSTIDGQWWVLGVAGGCSCNTWSEGRLLSCSESRLPS